MGSSRTPEELLYNFPALPRVRLAKYAKKFYRDKALEGLRQVCSDLALDLVPGRGLHWRRKAQARTHFRWGIEFWYAFPRQAATQGGIAVRTDGSSLSRD